MRGVLFVGGKWGGRVSVWVLQAEYTLFCRIGLQILESCEGVVKSVLNQKTLITVLGFGGRCGAHLCYNLGSWRWFRWLTHLALVVFLIEQKRSGTVICSTSPIIVAALTRQRFEAIVRYIHVVDSKCRSRDPKDPAFDRTGTNFLATVQPWACGDSGQDHGSIQRALQWDTTLYEVKASLVVWFGLKTWVLASSSSRFVCHYTNLVHKFHSLCSFNSLPCLFGSHVPIIHALCWLQCLLGHRQWLSWKEAC